MIKNKKITSIILGTLILASTVGVNADMKGDDIKPVQVIQKMKVEKYIQKSDNQILNITDFTSDESLREEGLFGVLKMELPKEKFETKEVVFEGKTYLDFYNDKMVDDEFMPGVALDKEGNVIGNIARIGGYKGTLFNLKDDFRPFYSAEKNVLEKAEYLAFRRPAKFYFSQNKVKSDFDCVLVVFDNPFKTQEKGANINE